MVDIVLIDGEKFTPEMAYWFRLMQRDFLKDTGCELHASSALRFSWEQEAIFKARYVPWYEVNGRYVYDVRWWNGVQWCRISSAGTVATPRTSNHEFEVTGVGAVDVYDSGSDAGVSQRGNARDRWMEQNAWKYYFDNEGYNFGEAWHKAFRGELFASRPNWAGGDAKPLPTPEVPEEEEEDMKNLLMIYIEDGEKRFTDDGGRVFGVTGPGYWTEFRTVKAVQNIQVQMGITTAANVDYDEWAMAAAAGGKTPHSWKKTAAPKS